MKPLDLPRLYISTDLLPKEMVLDVYDSSSDLDGFVKSLKPNIEIKPVKANRKDMLIKWLKSSGISNKYKIMGNNRTLDDIGVSLYHKSRPDFCLIPKNVAGTPSGIAVILDNEMEIHTKGDDEHKGTAKYCTPQLLANMMIVAGHLTLKALGSDMYFEQVQIYGMRCRYQYNETYLFK
uniref:Uncharacterized protein n=1 Tax=Amphimedon queenslandica TaxID=400682 RepID=A0A1X7U3H5_AMPQE